jgi:uncharacterized repeat protein (TIGR01451 family)
MENPGQVTKRPRTVTGSPPAGSVLSGLAFLLLVALTAPAASAQSFITSPTTTTLWAGTQDYLQFGLATLTAPTSGVILQGTAISAITGKPVRHLWYGDVVNGLCRIDPEVDAVIPPTAGIGGHFNNFLTCTGALNGIAITPGQIAYDPTTQMLYTEETGRASTGILRIQYVPSGDGGQGSINPLSLTSLLGTQTTRNPQGACPQLKDPNNGTLVPVVPNSAAIGPDGNLYTGSIRDGAIIRIVGPATFNPATDCPNGGNGTVTPLPTDRVNIPILSADERVGSGHTFGLGFIGTTLVGADNIAPWVLLNATQCYTPANGNKICGSPPMGGQAPAPTEILGSFVTAPQAAAATDAQFPTSTGTTAYFAAFSNLEKVTNLVSPTNITAQLNYGGTFSFITGLTADPGNLTAANLYVGVDQAQGAINGAGSIWLVSPSCAPAPSLPPGSVTAAIASTSLAANVSWVPTTSCSPTTSYVVRTLLAPALPGGAPSPSAIPDLTVAAPTTTAVVSALTAGVSYVFEVEACNATGCSAFSPLSNPITAVTVGPGIVTNVVAIDAGGGNSANVAWTVASTGNLPILSSTVSAFDTLTPAVVASTATVTGTATGATVVGLTCGHSYTFSVVVTNAAGTGAPSAPSLPLPIACPVTADVSILMSSPASVNPGSIVTYTMTVHNAGPASPAAVTLTDSLPGPLSSFTTTQGICSGTVGSTSFSCNLGPMAAGATATVTVSVSVPATCNAVLTNSASVSALSAAGVNIDANLANNTAAATTTLTIVAGCTATTTDIQVTGSAQNGGPALGSTDTFTWQIKNNLGTTPANNVVFTSTLPSNFTLFNAASTGLCTLLANTVTCQLGTIAGGQQTTVTVSFGVGAVAGTFSTTGTATFIGTDTNPANNSFTVTIGPK